MLDELRIIEVTLDENLGCLVVDTRNGPIRYIGRRVKQCMFVTERHPPTTEQIKALCREHAADAYRLRLDIDEISERKYVEDGSDRVCRWGHFENFVVDTIRKYYVDLYCRTPHEDNR